MSLSMEQPQSYPATFLTKRHLIPNHLHIVVERPSVHDIRSSMEFSYDTLNRSSIEAHFQHNVASSFISLYENEDTASKKRPHTEHVGQKPRSHDAVKVEVDTSGMTPAWISIENGVHIPVWFEEDSRDSDEAHNGEILWFCLEEVKFVLPIEDNIGEKGEWLACGFIPQTRVAIHSRPSNSDPPQRVFNDEEKHEADRWARREQIGIENERLQLGQQDFERMIKNAQSSRSFKAPPPIPARKSSLNSLACEAINEPKNEVSKGSKLSVTTRTTRVSLTNADSHNAASLMKYAILMAHGKRLEGEESWLSETASSAGGLDRAGSTRTIENVPRMKKQNGFAGRDVGILMTPPESPKGAFMRQDNHERRGRESGDDPTLRYELTLHDNDQSSQEERRRVRRSAAPSPSQSMLGFNLEGSNGSSLRPRRSRSDLLLELQSDQDSVLREYARVSLRHPAILQQVGSRSRRGSTNEDAESRIHHHEDSRSLISSHDHLATSTSSPLAVVPAHIPPSTHGAHDEACDPPHVNLQAPSLYSTMSSLASLSTFEDASVEDAVCTTVEPTSQINQVYIVRSKTPPSGSGLSDRVSSLQSTTRPQIQGQAESEAVVIPFTASNLQVQPDHTEREAQLPPKTKSAAVLLAPITATPTPLPSKSEAFLAKAKCLGEKGREITSRIAEMRERQKPKAKKEKW